MKPKKAILQFLGLLLLVAVVAAASCRFAGRFSCCQSPMPSHEGHSHHWVHEQLGISAEQEKQLEPVEARYRERCRVAEDKIRAANEDLARAVLEDKDKSERTDRAIGQIHEAMGEMQKATLDHVFEMKAVLSPAQYEKLLQLTADGLRQAGSD